ncbi:MULTISPECIES: flavin monoamine oxidase family protein [unclassified Acidovorax]|uniref:flavin monoamine oxidase family protein n=1 Tax=unclassified Acidovorax TaxID=2684926 RepID=UPI003857F275
MKTARIAIVGAGLSGLYAAWSLERMGLRDYVLLEARDTLGGRIVSASSPVLSPAPAPEHSVAAMPAASMLGRFDLGPTWFWPEYQPELDQLVHSLGLERFAQFEDGDVVLERSAHEPPQRLRSPVQSPTSMRLVGGMGALVDALRRGLEPARIHTGQIVRRLRSTATQVELDSDNVAGQTTTWAARHVLLALPPRLAKHTIAFDPPLPPALAAQWRATATWMAPQAKYIALYDTPFWREQGLSGAGRSARGPMAEIHDASMPGASGALFGFLGVPAQVRKGVADDELRRNCRAQLVRLFGPQAASPRWDVIKDWALDPYTATAADLESAAGHHAPAPATAAAAGPWRNRLTGIASEWSPQFPGYLAGAIEAAGQGVRAAAAASAQGADRVSGTT